MASMDLLFRFLGIDAGAGREFDRMSSKAGMAGKSLKSVGGAAVLAGGVVGVASIEMASKFQTAMTRIHTQANQSNKTVAALSKGILDMASSVAETPTELADAAYHIASIGQNSLTTAQQLRVLKIATEGAKIGGANLVDVTNALDAAIVSGIKGAGNYSKAMGVLNATVGAGDMQMQDLAEAFGPLGAVLAGYNVTLRQTGAALAVFGDNNLRGAAAGTNLRMAVQAMAVPIKTGQDQLQAWGIKAGNLSKQLEHGGLTSALDVLMKKMRAAGVSAKTQGDVLTQVFGKRAGTGINILMRELDRYHSKLKEVGKGADGFASSWKGYTKTFGYAWDSAKAAAERLFITLGTKLLPVATRFMKWVSGEAIPALGKFSSFISTKVVPVIGGILTDVIEGARNAFHRISHTIEENKGPLSDLLGAFKKVAGFVVGTLIPAIGPLLGGTLELMGMLISANIKVYAKLISAGKAVVHFFTGPFIHGIGAMVSLFINGLKTMADAALTAFGVIVHGGSKALGWVPYLGPKLKRGAQAFDDFKNSVDATLSSLAADAAHWGVTIGSQLDYGIVSGLRSGYQAVASSADAAARAAAINAAKHAGALGASYATPGGGAGFQKPTDAAGKKARGKAHADGLATATAFGDGMAAVPAIGGGGGIGSNAAKAAIKTGRWYAQGYAIGLGRGGKEVYLSAHQLAHQLALGLTEGWHGEALKVKDTFGPAMQTVLANMNTKLEAGLKKQQALLKTYADKLKSDLKTQASNIASLASQIAGNASISSVLNQTVSAGTATPQGGINTVDYAYTGNVGTYLSGQVALLKREAGMFAKLRKMGLAPALLSQISGMAPADAISVMTQILSGQDGSVASLSAAQASINAYSKQIATDTVKTRREQASLRDDRKNAHEQTRLLKQIDEHLKHFREHPRDAHQLTMVLQKIFPDEHTVRKIIAEWERLEKRGLTSTSPRKH